MSFEIFYFNLVWRGLKSIKLKKKKKIYPPLTNLQYKIIHSCNLAQFFTNVNKNKLKVWKFQTLRRLGSFSAIKKTVEGERGNFILFLSLFLSVHINFRYKLNYFVVTCFLFSSIALLIFLHLQFHCFFLFFYKFNEHVWTSSLTGSVFFCV